ncbi:MAG: Asp-tRNA(Asn)/Glu-tRNA(Gln) amidotransferase subunit GatC [Patescibacteria group bacterium]
MISADDIQKLATLGRISLTPAEVEKLQGEIGSILAYVDTVQKVALPEGYTSSAHLDIENVMREDENPHVAGMYTESLLTQAPRREGDYLKVKKVLS